ncbi:MAG: 2-C-methyl-D-erythritol 4-phosphate cytidylyltransferase [Candidatus Omnitrophota bacterium]
MSVIALVPSAGSGRRMTNDKDNKPFLELKGKPLLFYVLSRLEESTLVDAVTLIVKEKYIEEAKRAAEKFGMSKVTSVISGGETRSESVANGLASIKANEDDIILIHDGVRPFLKEEAIRSVVGSARKYGGAVLAVPCTSTIKKVTGEGVIEKTVDRKVLWEAQTPQAFRYDIIKKAYERFEGSDATDDSSFVERLGNKVCIVPGDKKNIKVTVPEDLKLAEAMLGAQEL